MANTTPDLPQRRSTRPLPQSVADTGNRYTLVQRVQCLTLLAAGFTTAYMERMTGVKERSQQNIRKKAFERGFRPEEDPRILESYMVDGERPGRPKEIREDIKEVILAAVRDNRLDRKKSSEVLAFKQGINY